MPDGFAPRMELERIYTLRELMTECRKRVPVVLRELDAILDDPDCSPAAKLQACDMVLNRGFGKPRQHVVIHETEGGADPASEGVKIYIPHNHREELNLPPLVIDQDGISQETEDAG